MKKKLPDFDRKCVFLSVAGDEHKYTIDEVRFEMQGGRLFIVGTVPRGATNGDWCEGAGCAVAWDAVLTYLVFDSSEDYQKGLAKFNKYKSKGNDPK